MQLHHSTTVTPARRPVRFNRRGAPAFAALPIDDETAIYLESAGEARMLIAQLAQVAEWFDSLEPPAATYVEMPIRHPEKAPTCAKCGDSEHTVQRGDQWTCWNTELCAERTEKRHLEAVTP